MYVRTNIYLPKKMIARYKALAKREGKTFSEVVREVLAREEQQFTGDWTDALLKQVERVQGTKSKT